MHIQSIPMWTGSSDNYAYLVVDDKTKDAVVIDPANPDEGDLVDGDRVAPVLKEQINAGKINLTAIVNTHHHWDHSGGNGKLLSDPEFKGKTVIGGKDCEAVTWTPSHGESFKIGDIAIKALYTPCHTQDSICWFVEDSTGKAVFTGDTLFHGGCGRFFEGTPEEMHTALNKTLAAVPDDTKVYSEDMQTGVKEIPDPLAKPKRSAKIIKLGLELPKGSQMTKIVKIVKIKVRIMVLKRPSLSAQKPGIKRPNTEPTFTIRPFDEEDPRDGGSAENDEYEADYAAGPPESNAWDKGLKYQWEGHPSNCAAGAS
ncbi:Hydroxyacylglutathione hydrolase [Chlorociboria aeruginascens]|nr:Hydroxyacylglutathione hydrolase [Chlorociboria aeruginascens]